MLNQLNVCLQQFNLLPWLQSAYRRCHSTETAVLKVLSDAFLAADTGQATLLGLLDLSAAFWHCWPCHPHWETTSYVWCGWQCTALDDVVSYMTCLDAPLHRVFWQLNTANYFTLDCVDKMNFRNPFLGLRFSHWGLLTSGGLRPKKAHLRSIVYAFHRFHWFAGKLFL